VPHRVRTIPHSALTRGTGSGIPPSSGIVKSAPPALRLRKTPVRLELKTIPVLLSGVQLRIPVFTGPHDSRFIRMVSHSLLAHHRDPVTRRPGPPYSPMNCDVLTRQGKSRFPLDPNF